MAPPTNRPRLTAIDPDALALEVARADHDIGVELEGVRKALRALAAKMREVET